MMNCLQSWPEPVVRVQSLSESGIGAIPDRYIKPPSDRPGFENQEHVDIPVVDLKNLFSHDHTLHEETLKLISSACKEWGFFQAVNHGISHELMKRTREKGAILDWSDYFFLHYLPVYLRNPSKWPSLPSSCRDLISEYGAEVVKLCGRLLKAMSISLGLKEDYLQNAFGGEDIGACLRVNFYPKCPQPDLTLGLSSHSDPGGMTLLLPDHDIAGLQVRKNGKWITVKPVPNAFIVNVGDQIQVMSNAIYKSVEHRVIVNSVKDRVSLAFFYNPKSDLLIEPAKELV
ncbi:hypothetical protein Gotri_025948, partial [Gossypium trilobum]|nr:hypothetical protein [Gossypium trilobum]